MRRASRSQAKARKARAGDSEFQFNWKALLVLLILSATEALAQEKRRGTDPAAVELGPAAAEARERRIVISIPDRKLALIEDGLVVKTYEIAVGSAETPSPSGEFRVTHRIPDPTWYAPGKVIGPGKENPLGTRWIGLSGERGFGIHGTNAPKSIGKAASHGCIRMRNRDVEELFALVKSGDTVVLHSERNDMVAAIFGAPAFVGPLPLPRAVAQMEVANGGL